MDVAIVDVSWLPTDDIVRNEESLALAVNWLVVDWQWKMRWPFFWQHFYLHASTVGLWVLSACRRVGMPTGA